MCSDRARGPRGDAEPGAGIEDAAALAQLLVTMGPTDEALARYEQLRRPRAERIRDRSWMIGRVAQWENGLARSVRDTLMRWTPESVARAELEKVVRDMPGVPVG